MARFFIDRPVFAIVIALLLLLAGTLTLFTLPVGEFPQIALPTVKVSASYLGASSDVVEQSVTVPLDQQINGVTDMLYITSVSGDDGSTNIDVTFRLERDPDIASVEVQNRVSQAQSQLPAEVIQQGVTVRKQSPDTLMYFALHSPDSSYDAQFINNYATIYAVDMLKRIKGVGDVRVFGYPFGMRIWLRPDRMASLKITAADIAQAVREQNVQAPAGQVGQPPAQRGQSFQYSVRVQGRLVTADQFADVIVGAKPDGSFIRLRDVGRVELGSQRYEFSTELEGNPAVILSIALAPGANAMETADLVKSELANIERGLPEGLAIKVMYDTSEFVEASIEEVVHTFFEALILVLVVVAIFLQSWRATLIAMLAIPVSIIATFIFFGFLDFSVNTLSLFGLILAIGIVVDDAIVVVEAVEHKMEHEGLTPLEATRNAMDEVQGPIVATSLIVAAVFIPMAFIPGVTGQLYKQFALTLSVSVAFSALTALTLTPALCAMLLKPRVQDDSPGPLQRFFRAFNRVFDRIRDRYGAVAAMGARRTILAVLTLGIVVVLIGGLQGITPTGFVPDEDKGSLFMQIILPEAASQERTMRVAKQVQEIASGLDGIETAVAVTGFDLLSGTAASNGAFVIVRLDRWDARSSRDLHALSILQKLAIATRDIPEAIVVPFNPPALPGFGAVSGFNFMLQARGGQSPEELAAVARELVAAAQKRPEIGRVTTTFAANTPNYRLDVDREKVKKLGVPINDVFATLQTFLGGYQINDFTRFGRNYKVTMQAEPEFRQEIDDIALLFVRNNVGDMVPLDTVTTATEGTGARYLQRYNLFGSASITGSPAPGASSGDALGAMEAVAAQVLPSGYGYEWTGQSLQEIEAGNAATVVLGLSIVVVFLFLAALYESWAVPFAVLLATPFGFLGAFAALKVTGLDFNVYGQIGLVTLIALSAKNAILIVEFAKLNHEKGMPLIDSAMDAARLRFRPIIMTSLAFILGVVPLMAASGAGAASKVSVGTAVFGGMIGATVLTSLAVPAFYVLIQGLAERFDGTAANRAAAPSAGGDST
jgi:hydrophobe/amphiphile efflux-1 (HAE1) family protein